MIGVSRSFLTGGSQQEGRRTRVLRPGGGTADPLCRVPAVRTLAAPPPSDLTARGGRRGRAGKAGIQRGRAFERTVGLCLAKFVSSGSEDGRHKTFQLGTCQSTRLRASSCSSGLSFGAGVWFLISGTPMTGPRRPRISGEAVGVHGAELVEFGHR